MSNHNKSLAGDMPKAVKCVYYALVLFGNAFINKLSGSRVEILLP